MTEQKNSYNEKQFQHKCYLCIQLLGGQSDILSLIGSWHDSLPEKDVLDGIDQWLKDRIQDSEQSFEYIKKSINHDRTRDSRRQYNNNDF